MKLVKYNPETLSLFDWNNVLDRFFDDPVFNTGVPAIDVREEDNAYMMEAELPGLTEKDIELKVEGNLLSLSSKKDAKKEEKKKGYILKERHSSYFSRVFTLPESVDKNSIKAEFKNGLLKVTLPKKPVTRPKLININN